MQHPSRATNRFELGLRREAMFSVPDAAGVQIECRSGTVWITLDGDPRDFVLEAHDSFSTPEHRRALIYAMKPSCITVQATHQAGHSPSHGLVFQQIQR